MVLIALRFFHFGPELDNPHVWRQSDVAFVIRDFYRHGVDLLHPAVCWMGNHKTLIFDFPIYQAITALLSGLMGPSLITARLVALMFFVFSARYLYLIAVELLDIPSGRVALLIYLITPLSLFYSRAVHVDFTAMCFSLGMTYHYLLAIRNNNMKHLLIGTALALFAWLVKAPYVFYMVFPLAWEYFRQPNKKWLLFRSPLLLIPIAAFWAWTRHVYQVNGEAPDWHFIPNYRLFNDNSHWYYGTWQQRTDPENWLLLIRRLQNEAAGWITSGLAILGVFFSLRIKKNATLLLWLLGVVVYLVIFFNLNVIHNYYQIPFVPLIAIFASVGIQRGLAFASRSDKRLTIAIILMAITGENLLFAEQNYYGKPDGLYSVGHVINQETPPNSLVLVSSGGLTVHCPIILYAADRTGWSVPAQDLSAKIALKLYQEGCRYIILHRPDLPGGEFEQFITYFSWKKVMAPDEQEVIICDMTKKADGSPYNGFDNTPSVNDTP